MKRKFLTTLLALIASLCLCFGLAACGVEGEVNEHTHNWVWKNNSSEHWQICETDNVEKSGSRSAHFDNDEDGKCDECKYSIEDDGPVAPVEYTVTYNANGGLFEDGEETKSVKVKENDRLEIPEEPTRDDFTFVQWCTDSSLDTKWNFESDIVTHDTMLYAQWETVIVEHNVTFILNYEGAEEVVKSTENDLITYIPERADYVFNGWWLSDGQTESGEYILAQKYDTAEPVTEDGLVLVAEWVEKSTVSSQLPAPSVSINANVFSWLEVAGAVSYDIRVYESGSREEKLKETVHGTSWTFPSGYDAGYYTVKIRAMGDGKTTVNSSYVSKSYGHLILSAISKIDFDITSSILTWTAVRNATSYVLYINNIEVETLSYTTFDLSDYEAGEYSIKIVAQRNGYQSSTTTKTIQKLRLKTPNIRLFVDKQNDCYVVMWDSVANADTYLLDFGGTEVKVTDETSYSFDNSASFWKGADSITLSMTAFDSDADYLVSNPTAELTVTQIYTVTIEKNIDEAGTITTSGAIYIPQTFKIVFDLNGASGNVSTQYVTAKNAITYPTIPTRSGYVFRGWYTTKSCYELYDFTAEVTKDITLYAGWYEITTEGDGNYILDIISNYYSSSKAYSVSTSGTTSSNAKYMYFRALTRGTYTLYYKNSSSTTNNGTYLNVYNATQGRTLYSNSRINSTSYTSLQMTLEAGDVVYIRNYAYNSSYSATFYFYITGASKPSAGGLGTGRYLIKGTNDSTSSDPKIIADLNTPITLTATTTDDRYIFDGWYNGDTLLTKESSYSYTVVSQNPNLTAKWIYYSVTTQKNLEDAGTITSHSDSPIKVGDSVTITARTNSGYTWLGWYDGENILTDELSYTFTMTAKSVNYTAKWTYYTLTTTANDEQAGYFKQSYGETKVTAGNTVTLTAVTNKGYTFVGWYKGGEEVATTLSFQITMGKENVTYEARWCKVTLSVNDASAGSVRQLSSTYKVGDEVTLTAVTNTGYTFVGWYRGEEEVATTLSFQITMGKENVTYEARWCKVTLSVNDSSAGSVKQLYSTYKVGDEVTLTAVTNTGYTFVGWYKGEEKVATTLSFQITMGKENVTYEARWTYYTLTTNKNLDDAGSTTIYNERKIALGENVTLTATTYTGCKWLGWYDGDNRLTEELSYTFEMPARNLVYTAKWEYFTVTVEKNIGAAGSVSVKDLDSSYSSSVSRKILPGSQVQLTASTNDGYTWMGWYKGEQLITADLSYSFSMGRENYNFTAKWTYYTLTTSGNMEEAGSYTVKNEEKITAGTSVTLTSSTKDGYNWLGWYIEDSLQTKDVKYTFDMPHDSLIVEARWNYYTLTLEATEGGSVNDISPAYTVSFNLNGAGGSVAAQTITEKQGLVYPTVPTRSGYVFRGWFKDQSCTEIYDFTSTVTENITVYAGWQAMYTGSYYSRTIGSMNGYSSTVTTKAAAWGSGIFNYYLVYFTCYTSGYYYFHYKASSSVSGVGAEITLRNLNSDALEVYEAYFTSSSYKTELVIANAGDVLCLQFYSSRNVESISLSYYFDKKDMPSAGGKAQDNGFKNDGNRITANEYVTITAVPQEGYAFLGWFDGGRLVSKEMTYSFVMPEEDVSYIARFEKTSEVNMSCDEEQIERKKMVGHNIILEDKMLCVIKHRTNNKRIE